METDPDDGKITFFEVEVDNFKIEYLGDVALLFDGMQRIGESIMERAGYIIYPIVKLEDLG